MRPKKISCYNATKEPMTLIETFSSIAEASNTTGIGSSRIIEYCKGKYRKTRGGITFRYAKKEKHSC